MIKFIKQPNSFVAFLVWLLVYLIGGYPTLLFAFPNGGDIVHGTGTITQPDASTMVINQTTNKMITNWQGFSIGAAESVRFNQPSSTSAALNRVIGADPSRIFGKLSSNGQVFLSNPAGIHFGPNASVNVGALMATTLKISDQDFLNKQYNFFHDPNSPLASILNEGNINAANGFVGLLAPSVQNTGTITANLGSIALASGKAATMDFTGEGLINFAITEAVDGKVVDKDGNEIDSGVLNAGLLKADGGQITLTARDATDVIRSVVNNTGIIEANSVVEKNGKIFLMGDTGSVNNSGTVSASGDDPGEAGGSVTLEASTVTLDGGEVSAAGFQGSGVGEQGAGGNISIRGTDWVGVGGTVDASGDTGGNVTIDAGGLSLAAPVLARGSGGQGGNISITTAYKSWENTDALIDASGASGGTITHIADQQITSSATYKATGTDGKGGQIDITAPAMKFLSGTIDASGHAGGGNIRLGGAFQGGKNQDLSLVPDPQSTIINQQSSIPNAQIMAMTDATVVKADATGDDGNGGTIIVWADQKATILGQLSAQPGTFTGAGGFIEASSAGDLTFGGNAQTGDGTLLLDPKNIIIAEEGYNQYAVIIGFNYASINADQLTLDIEDYFGQVSLDGNRLAVGTGADDGSGASGGVEKGAVYLFTFTDANFSGATLQATIGSGYTGGKNVGLTLDNSDYFGTSVSLDGNRLAVGATGVDGVTNAVSLSGAVYLFTFTDSAFTGASLVSTIGSGYTGGKNINQTLEATDNFGFSVSMDGNRLAVSAAYDDGPGNAATDSGAVYLYTFTDSAFSGGTLQAIIGSGYSGGKNYDQALDASDTFGYSVSLDGNRLAVGAEGDDGPGVANAANYTGAVYLYTFTDTAFSGTALAATIGSGYTGAKDFNQTLEANDRFGNSVSLDGNRLAVGSPSDDGSGNAVTDSGAVYLYTFTDSAFSGGALAGTIGSGYTGAKDINQTLEAGDNMGSSVSLNGNRLAVTASGDDGNANAVTSSGAVYLYTFTDSAFTGGSLAGTLGNGYSGGKNVSQTLDVEDYFGQVSLDGNRLAVGTGADDGSGASGALEKGAVYLYTFTDANFSGATLQATIGSGYTGGKSIGLTLDNSDYFGTSVSLDGNRLAVGATGVDGVTNAVSLSGAVYLFTFTDSAFTGGSLVSTIGSGYGGAKDIDQTLEATDNFGFSVSLDGNRLAVSAAYDDGSGNAVTDSGAVYLYTFTDSAFSGGTLQTIIGSGYSGGKNYNQALDASDTFGYSVSLDGNRLAVGAAGDDGSGNTVTGSGAVYLYTFTDTTFSNTALAAAIGSGYTGTKDINQALDANDTFARAVSLDGNRLAVGAAGDDGSGNGCNSCGAVYLYTFTDSIFSGGSLLSTMGSGYTGGKNINLNLEAVDSFGASVSLDGNQLAVTASGDDGSGNAVTDSGAVYLFNLDHEPLTQPAVNQYAMIMGYNYANINADTLALDASDNFGETISLDGNRLAVGARNDDGSGNPGNVNASGAVYLYTFTDSSFGGATLQSIIGSGYTGGKNYNQTLDTQDSFGSSVSLDGNRLAVGARGDDGSGTTGDTVANKGAVYLYTFTDSAFTGTTQQGVIGNAYAGGKNVGVTLDNSDQFGWSVSLDGNRLAVGALADGGSGNAAANSGAVYLFTFKDSAFSGGALATTIGSGYATDPGTLEAGDMLGSSVSLDGNRLAVGAYGDKGATNAVSSSGSVYLYTFTDSVFSGASLAGRIGSGYTGTKDINLALEQSDYLGASVSLDGTRLAVGAFGDDGSGVSYTANNEYGAVYLFTFTDSSFSNNASTKNNTDGTGALQAIFGSGYNTRTKDVGHSLETSEQFGAAVSLDGTRLAVGAPFDDGSGNAVTDSGAVYLYTFTDSAFSGGAHVGTIGSGYSGGKNVSVASLATTDYHATSVSLNGNRLAVGSPYDDGPANGNADAGAVYLYTFTDTAFSGATLQSIIGSGYTGGKNINQTLATLDWFGGSVSLDGNRLAVGSHGDDGTSGSQTGAVYLYTFTDSVFSGGALAATIGDGAGYTINQASLDTLDSFGYSVSLDGTRLAVGAYQDDGSGLNNTNSFGAVYLYTFSDTAFNGGSLAGTIGSGYSGGKNLSQSLGAGDRFGISLSMDGNRLAVGAAYDDGGANGNADSGAVYLYSFADSFFSGGSLEAVLGSGYSGSKDLSQALDSADEFGRSVSLDGNRLAVGATMDDGSNNGCTDCGAVYLYSFTDAVFNGGSLDSVIGNGYGSGKNINQSLDTIDYFGRVSLDGNRLAVGASGDDGPGASSTTVFYGAVYLYDLDPSYSLLSYSNQSGSDVTMTPTTLARLLGSPQDVILQASNDITLNNDLYVDNPAGHGGDLYMQAGRSIFLNANITTDDGDLRLIANDLLANGVVDADRDAGAAVITQAAGTFINAGVGDVFMEMAAGTGKTNLASGDITLDRITTTGLVEIDNTGPTAGSDILTVNSSSLITAGTLDMITTSAGGSVGLTGQEVRTNVSNLTVSATGNIFLIDSGASGNTTLNGVLAGPGNTINLTVQNNDMLIWGVGTTGGTMRLEATNGAIQNVAGYHEGLAADTATLLAGTGMGTSTSSIGTAFGTLTASVTGVGGIFLGELNDITLSSVTTASGNIGITAGGTITEGTVTATGGTATLTGNTATTPAADPVLPDTTQPPPPPPGTTTTTTQTDPNMYDPMMDPMHNPNLYDPALDYFAYDFVAQSMGTDLGTIANSFGANFSTGDVLTVLNQADTGRHDTATVLGMMDTIGGRMGNLDSTTLQQTLETVVNVVDTFGGARNTTEIVDVMNALGGSVSSSTVVETFDNLERGELIGASASKESGGC